MHILVSFQHITLKLGNFNDCKFVAKKKNEKYLNDTTKREKICVFQKEEAMNTRPYIQSTPDSSNLQGKLKKVRVIRS